MVKILQANCTYFQRLLQGSYMNPRISRLVAVNIFFLQLPIWGNSKFVPFFLLRNCNRDWTNILLIQNRGFIRHLLSLSFQHSQITLSYVEHFILNTPILVIKKVTFRFPLSIIKISLRIHRVTLTLVYQPMQTL